MVRAFAVVSGFGFLQSIISVHSVDRAMLKQCFWCRCSFLICVLKIVKFFLVPWWQLVLAASDICHAHIVIFILFGQTVL